MVKKVILYIATSLDGYIARKNGSVDWLDKFQTSGEDYGYVDFIKKIDTVIMGNATYEQILCFGKYPYPGQKGYVFTTKQKKDENVTFVKGDIKKFIDTLDNTIEGHDHNIWLVGGANLVAQFLSYNLIDEFLIFIMPVLLGEGIKLFDNNKIDLALNLKKSKTYKSGTIELQYELGK